MIKTLCFLFFYACRTPALRTHECADFVLQSARETPPAAGMDDSQGLGGFFSQESRESLGCLGRYGQGLDDPIMDEVSLFPIQKVDT